MARKGARKNKPSLSILRSPHPDAAGIDIGAEEIYVAVPPDRNTEPVRSFGTFTRDLRELCEWLRSCGIRTVAMEATGVYWIPLLQLLETHGFEVVVANATRLARIPGRRSDVSDCQWIQYLHSAGLLTASFRPPDRICVLRSLSRHRQGLIQMAAMHVQQMQKALIQMNLQLHNVLSDITGISGLAILDAILRGERDPIRLAGLCNRRVQSAQEIVAKSLEGDYRSEHLFALRQSLAAWRFYKRLVVEVDREVEMRMRELPRSPHAQQERPRGTKPLRSHRGVNEPAFDLKSELYRVAGVDLTDIPGIDTLTAHSILMEIGTDVSRFRNASAFASWLGLCPEKAVSGGKILRTGSRRVKNRVANALRQGAQCLYHAKNPLGEFYRRSKQRLGAASAVTVTAHKLARIVYHLLSTKQPYSEDLLKTCELEARARAEMRLRKQAAALGLEVSRHAIQCPSGPVSE